MTEAASFSKAEKRVISKMGYSIAAQIGSGSYANVYMAEYTNPEPKTPSETEHPQKLACKVINLRTAPEEIVIKFIPRELDILPKLDHKHIIRTHSILFMPDVERYYIFMQLGENGDLLHFLVQYGALRERRAQIIFRQLLSALNYLYGKKIAHRDIKCENLLLTKGYNIKLADFGFARTCTVDVETKQVLQAKTYCGSLQYTGNDLLLLVLEEQTKNASFFNPMNEYKNAHETI